MEDLEEEEEEVFFDAEESEEDHRKAQLRSKASASRGEMLQVLTEDGVFAPSLASTLTKWGFDDKSDEDYLIVAIFGCKAGGKSTLLNRVFGTQFPVMRSGGRRQQTTRGVWFGRCRNPGMLVIDTEGTDSRERGADIDFMRRAALFALALSEVLIINMPEKDMGRFEAANISLVRIVLEEQLKMFSRSGSKQLIFFAIRDVDPDSTFEEIQKQMLESVGKIWSNCEKPERFTNSPASDFFDFSVHALPHMKLESDQFARSVDRLRAKFYGRQHAHAEAGRSASPEGGGAFVECYQNGVPGDGLAEFAEEHVWRSIMQDKDLDIPTQRVLLATSRCDKIQREVFRGFAEEIEPHKDAVSGERSVPLSTLKASLRRTFQSSIESFDERARRYATGGPGQQTAASRQRQELVALMCHRVESVVGASTEHHMAERKIDAGVDDIVGEARPTLWGELKALVVGTAQKACDDFIDGIEYIVGTAGPSFASSSKREEMLHHLRQLCLEHCNTRLLRAPQFLQRQMQERFDRRFCYDERGVMRIWGPFSKIDDTCAVALSESKALLTLFEVTRWTAEIVANEKELLTRADRATLERALHHFADPKFKAAVREQRDRTGSTDVPLWAALLCFLLGYDKIIACLFSPLRLILLGGVLVLLVVVSLAWRAGLLPAGVEHTLNRVSVVACMGLFRGVDWNRFYEVAGNRFQRLGSAVAPDAVVGADKKDDDGGEGVGDMDAESTALLPLSQSSTSARSRKAPARI